jgi:hypothetical protein
MPLIEVPSSQVDSRYEVFNRDDVVSILLDADDANAPVEINLSAKDKEGKPITIYSRIRVDNLLSMIEPCAKVQLQYGWRVARRIGYIRLAAIAHVMVMEGQPLEVTLINGERLPVVDEGQLNKWRIGATRLL